MTHHHGNKTVGPSLDFMRGSWLVLLAAPLWGAPRPEPLVVQELRGSVQELNFKVRAQESEIQILEDRLANLEVKLERQSRVTAPQPIKRDEAVIDDIKTLKNHLEKTQAALLACEKRVTALDKQFEKDIGALKSSLQSMLALLKGEEKSYTVKTGDSLGKIAFDHKTTSKKIKELNNLSSDTIFPGQKLNLP